MRNVSSVGCKSFCGDQQKLARIERRGDEKRLSCSKRVQIPNRSSRKESEEALRVNMSELFFSLPFFAPSKLFTLQKANSNWRIQNLKAQFQILYFQKEPQIKSLLSPVKRPQPVNLSHDLNSSFVLRTTPSPSIRWN